MEIALHEEKVPSGVPELGRIRAGYLQGKKADKVTGMQK